MVISEKFKLYAVSRWGSMMPELVFQHSKLDYEVIRMERDDVRKPEFLKINPIGQIPTLILPNGETMTESLAICMYLDKVAKTNLVPADDSPDLPKFLRWATFVNTNVYGMAAFADHPDWWLSEKSAQNELFQSVTRKTEERFLIMEKECGEPHFLGHRLSLLDLFLSVMNFWDPSPNFFRERTPKIQAIVDRYRETPQFKAVLERNPARKP